MVLIQKMHRSFLFLCEVIYSTQKTTEEIIKVREWISNIGLLSKVIRLKLFLDMVPSSSEDVTCAMREQPKRLSGNNPKWNGGDSILFFLIPFHNRDVLCILSRLFCSAGFHYFVLLIRENVNYTTANF